MILIRISWDQNGMLSTAQNSFYGCSLDNYRLYAVKEGSYPQNKRAEKDKISIFHWGSSLFRDPQPPSDRLFPAFQPGFCGIFRDLMLQHINLQTIADLAGTLSN
ncbi:hypothetical protein EYY61_21115 [Pantoea agglomerans]|nr:hypothetical protein [Pantoea agglomerans]MVT82923.1 hypothetical protein [Pantoea agglomerans]TCZ26513.1 hypothetical protein EYB39_13305 [Pantoea agglomerans]